MNVVIEVVYSTTLGVKSEISVAEQAVSVNNGIICTATFRVELSLTQEPLSNTMLIHYRHPRLRVRVPQSVAFYGDK